MSQVIESGSEVGKLAGSDLKKVLKGAAIAAAAAALSAIIVYLGKVEIDNEQMAFVVAGIAIALNFVRKLLTNTTAKHTVGLILAALTFGLAFGLTASPAIAAGSGLVVKGQVSNLAGGDRIALGFKSGPRTVLKSSFRTVAGRRTAEGRSKGLRFRRLRSRRAGRIACRRRLLCRG